MEILFVPKRLKAARHEIFQIHQNSKKQMSVSQSKELEELIESLVCIPASQLKMVSYSLTDRELEMVAGYIPHNYFKVDRSNLFKIFAIRSSEKMCEILYNHWQENYQDEECNQFICEDLKEDKNWDVFLKKNHLSALLFDEILREKQIAYRFGMELKKYSFGNMVPLGERLKLFAIRESSQLYSDCAFYFYTYCERMDYLASGVDSLLRIVSKYCSSEENILKLFAQNFLEKLSLKDLLSFREIAGILRKKIGDSQREIQTFFEGCDHDLIRKYTDWINIYKVNEYFGNDERSEFWKHCRFLSVRRYAYSDSLVMEFDNYYAVEFLGARRGPIYIYPRKYFETNVQNWFVCYNNSDMRDRLLHRTKWFERTVHSIGWQSRMKTFLIINRITEWMNI